MQKAFYSLLIFLFALSQENVKLNSTPMKENAVEFNELATLMDEEEGYYDATFASVSPKGHIVVADAGNKTIHIYDKNFKHIHQFGKEGNGPGEIDRIGTIKATSERIYVSSYQRLMIFKYDGNFVSEMNLFQYGSAQNMITDNGITMIYSNGNPKYRLMKYDIDGNEIEKVANESYEEPKDEQGGFRMVFFSGNGYAAINGGYVNNARGEYGIEIMDENFNVKEILTRSFTRIPRDFNNFSFSLKVDGASAKKQAEMQAAAKKKMMEQMGQFKDDVGGIIGVHNGYIFARVAAEDDEKIIIDVISPEFNYYTQIELDGEFYESSL